MANVSEWVRIAVDGPYRPVHYCFSLLLWVQVSRKETTKMSYIRNHVVLTKCTEGKKSNLLGFKGTASTAVMRAVRSSRAARSAAGKPPRRSEASRNVLSISARALPLRVRPPPSSLKHRPLCSRGVDPLCSLHIASVQPELIHQGKKGGLSLIHI